MNHSTSTAPTSVLRPPSSDFWPVVYAKVLARRLRERFGEVLTSATRIEERCDEQIRRQDKLASDIAASDDPLEREGPELVAALQNDPPEVRARILAAVRATERNIAARAAECRTHCPEALLQD